MDVKIDISHNVRFTDKESYLGVATDNGDYKKNIVLKPAVKKE